MCIDMEPTEIFKISFRRLLNETNTTQVDIAKHLNVKPRSVNDYLGGRVNYSEQRRMLIAQYFGKTYLGMLQLGHKLTTGTEPIAPDTSVNLKDVVSKLESMNQQDLKLINDMVTRLSKN